MNKTLTNENLVNLVLLASSLQILESLFPHPIPAVRLGLANLVSLLVVVKFGLFSGLKVAVLRCLVSSLFLGSFLSVSFILSLFASLAAVVCMWLVYNISLNTFLKFSIVGVSIFGALAHNFTQIFLVYLFFIKQTAIFFLTPVLIISAVAFGSIVGMMGLGLIDKLKDFNVKEINKLHTYDELIFENKKNYINLWLVIFLIVVVLVFSKVYLQVGIFFITLILFFLNRISLNIYFKNIKKIFWFLVFSFFVPLIFTSGEKKLLDFKIFIVSVEAVYKALIYSLRLINIVGLSTFITNVYSKQTLVNLVKNLIFFNKELAEVLAISFYNLPYFLEDVKSKFKFKSAKEFYKSVSDIFLEYIT